MLIAKYTYLKFQLSTSIELLHVYLCCRDVQEGTPGVTECLQEELDAEAQQTAPPNSAADEEPKQVGVADLGSLSCTLEQGWLRLLLCKAPWHKPMCNGGAGISQGGVHH